MIRRKFYFCSDQVKNKLFSAYCNTIMCVFAMGLLSKENQRDTCASLLYVIILRFVSCVVCR